MKTLLALSASAMLIPFVPAFAQDAPPPTRTRDALNTDIIVTARRSEERLQDVPISVTVFNQESLTNKGITNTNDLATYTPSLGQSNVLGNLQATFSLRGFNQELGTAATVGVFFADVVAPRGAGNQQQVGDGAGPGSFFDLANVQVLKGPQGTLFGRNTTGGAILIVPKKPTDQLEGYIEGGYGNYDMWSAQGVLNVPLGESARLRVGFDHQKRDGYVKNLSSIGPNAFNDIDYWAGRASLVVDLTPDLENYIIATYTHSKTAGEANNLYQTQFQPTVSFPNGAGGTISVPGALVTPFAFLAQTELDQRPAGAGFFSTENALPNPRTELSEARIINTTTWKASDNLTVKNILSYAELKYDLLNPVVGVALPLDAFNPYRAAFGANFGIPAAAIAPFPAGTTLGFTNSNPNYVGHIADQSTMIEELQFQGTDAGGALRWQAGAYYEDSKPLGNSGSTTGNLLIVADPTNPFRVANPFFGFGSIGYNDVRKKISSKGLYGQASYDVAEKLTLTAGIRYTWDRTDATGALRNYRVPYNPLAPLTFYDIDPQAYYCQIPGALRSNDCNLRVVQKSSAPTWLLGIDYKPSRDVLLYGKYSRGYRTGGVSLQLPVEYQTYGPEKVDTYEVGSKLTFNGAVRGTFNVAAFYNNFQDQQVPIGFNPKVAGAAANQTGVINAGKSRIYGMEVETAIQPFEGMVLSAGYSYLNTKIQKVDVPNFDNGVYVISAATAPAPGDRLSFTPKHKVSATAAYTLPLDKSIGDITLSTTYTYNGNRVGTYRQRDAEGNLNGFSLLSSYQLWDFNLNWAGVGGMPVDLSAFVNNAFQEKYRTYILDIGQGFQTAQLGRARTYGLRLRYSFGN